MQKFSLTLLLLFPLCFLVSVLCLEPAVIWPHYWLLTCWSKEQEQKRVNKVLTFFINSCLALDVSISISVISAFLSCNWNIFPFDFGLFQFGVGPKSMLKVWFKSFFLKTASAEGRKRVMLGQNWNWYGICVKHIILVPCFAPSLLMEYILGLLLKDNI